MMVLDAILDRVRGRAITIPPMDGALRPNEALDEAPAVIAIAMPDNLCRAGDRILFSSGERVLALPTTGSPGPVPVAAYGAPVSAIAVSPGGRRAVGLDDGRVIVEGGDREAQELAAREGCGGPTAMAFADGATLLVCHGSATRRPVDWAADLMERNASGSLWRVDLESGQQSCLARHLAYPYGLLLDAAGKRVVVAESWRHRLVEIPLAGGMARPLLADLPAYPARLAPAADGGAWLALFAPRNRLIEMVLRERRYREDMLREIPREHWIAPALSSGASFLEPLQCGGVKTMGIHKPWSPSRSYGLVARLDREMRLVKSFHSRANGRRHGVTSVIAFGNRVLVAAKGGGAILALDDRESGEA
jgi:hypothetical protein